MAGTIGTPSNPLRVAILGFGPAGFYAAAELLQQEAPAVHVDMFDRLPTPYGLVRGGVAPDHQKIKSVIKLFARTAERPGFRFFGNVTFGEDVTLDELLLRYHQLLFCTGCETDNHMGIPGEDLKGSYPATIFVGWYNGHPDFRDLDPDLDTAAVGIIGNGNVAIDVARVLVKTPAEMATSDLADHAAQAIHAAPIRDVYIIGRRGPAQAKFTNKELGEMGALEDCAALVDPAQLPAAVAGEMSDRDRRQREKNLATLRSFPSAPEPAKGKCVHFVFFAQPEAISGAVRCAGLRLERTRLEDDRAVGTGQTFEIHCGVVVFAVGYRMDSLDGVPSDEPAGTFESRDGRVADGLYVVGWAKRGPSGVIGTNKGDGDLAAEQIRADIPPGRKAGRAALESLLTERRLRWVSFADWQRIDAAETAAAPEAAPRRKLVRIADMLAVLDRDAGTVTNT